jgi:hypothetical protein
VQRLKNIANNSMNLNQGEMFLRIFSQPDKQQLVITLNQRSQLFEQGVNSLGRIIGTYSPATESISRGRKRAGQPYTLLDTGEFYDSFEIVNVQPNYFTIWADGNKEDENLFEKYGNEILGLTEQSIERLTQMILPEIIFLTKKQILK